MLDNFEGIVAFIIMAGVLRVTPRDGKVAYVEHNLAVMNLSEGHKAPVPSARGVCARP